MSIWYEGDMALGCNDKLGAKRMGVVSILPHTRNVMQPDLVAEVTEMLTAKFMDP